MNKSNRVNPIVEEFFSEYLAPGYISTDTYNAFSNYFVIASKDELRNVELEFTKIIMHYRGAMNSFKLEGISNNFCIIRFYNDSGDLVTPPVGFWYVLDDSSIRILEWRLAVLQPFSRMDAEYSADAEEWG